LKPATGAFDGFAENEHFCLRLAGELGFPTASSSVQYFGDCPVITVERYDRIRQRDGVIRVHQEDLCQALAEEGITHPVIKRLVDEIASRSLDCGRKFQG
jgi:serine/threonine-protein kinase HipA